MKYTGLGKNRKKFKKDSGEINSFCFHRNMRVCILEINCEGLVCNRQFVYYFVNSGLRVEIIFRKERTAENWGLILK